MLEPYKILDRLWDKIEKAKISRKRKDFLLTVVALAIVLYSFSILLLVIVAKQLADLIEKLLNLP